MKTQMKLNLFRPWNATSGVKNVTIISDTGPRPSRKFAKLKRGKITYGHKDERKREYKNKKLHRSDKPKDEIYVIKIIPLASYVTRPGPALLLEIKLFSNGC